MLPQNAYLLETGVERKTFQRARAAADAWSAIIHSGEIAGLVVGVIETREGLVYHERGGAAVPEHNVTKTHRGKRLTHTAPNTCVTVAPPISSTPPRYKSTA